MPREKKSLCAWPDDLARTPLLDQFASTLGLDPESEWEAFHDSALANGRKYADWMAAFRTWCRNAAKWKDEKIFVPSRKNMAEMANGNPIGFTVPKRQPEAVIQALRDNEEAARETAEMNDDQRRAAIRKLGEIWRSIK